MHFFRKSPWTPRLTSVLSRTVFISCSAVVSFSCYRFFCVAFLTPHWAAVTIANLPAHTLHQLLNNWIYVTANGNKTFWWVRLSLSPLWCITFTLYLSYFKYRYYIQTGQERNEYQVVINTQRISLEEALQQERLQTMLRTEVIYDTHKKIWYDK